MDSPPPPGVRRRPLELLTTGRALRATSDTPFVGREPELAALERLLRDAVDGRGGVVLISGEPGIGKSRLAEELAHVAVGSGVRVLRSRCWEGGGAPALYPWTRLLRAARGSVAGIEDLLATIEPGGAAGPVPFALLDALASKVVELATASPMLVLVDDLHAADTATLAALVLLADSIANVGVLIVGTYRDEDARRSAEVNRQLTELARRGRTMALHGLGSDAVARLVELRTEGPPPADSVATLTAATGGNPFFLEQLLPVIGQRPFSSLRDLPVPEQVREAIRWRVAPLEDATRALLATAAVLGRSFDTPTLAAVSDQPVEHVLERLAGALSSGLIRALPHVRGRYEFVHSLVRETLYDDLGAPRRQELHRDVAELLAGIGADGRTAEIAHHRLAALPLGDPASAVAAARRAAARACELAAYDDAASLYHRVVELLDASGAPAAERCAARLALGEAQRLGGDTSGSRETFLAASELAVDPEQLAEAALGYATGLGGHGFVDRGDDTVIALLERAVRELGTDDSALRARLLARLAVELYYTGAVARREALSREALLIAERVGDPHALLVARYSRVWCRLGPDEVDERRSLAEQLTESALELGDGEMLLRGEHLRLATALETGDIIEVDRALERYARYVERVRQPLYRWHLEVLRAMRSFIAGDLAEGERRLHHALDLGLPVQGDTAALLFGVQLCTLRWAQGRIGEVEPAIRVFVEQYPSSAWRPALVVAATEAGRLDEARALFDQLAVDDFSTIARDGNWLTIMCYLALPCSALHDRERAEVLYALLSPYAGRTAVANAGAVCYGSVSTFLGILATTAGRLEDAERHFELGLVHNLAIGHRVMAAWTLWRYAEVVSAMGDRSRANAMVADARRQSAELGVALRPVEAQPPPLPAAAAVFRREGDYWTVVYGERTSRLRDGKGPRYLAQLLANPGQRIAATDLAGGEQRWTDGSAGPVLDAQAKSAYQQRLRDLAVAREEAHAFNDPERIAVIDAEVEAISTELNRAIGLGGRDRPTASPAERARVSVTKVLKQTIRRIADDNPELGAHLDAAVRTGAFCIYQPSTPESWDL